MSFRVIPHLDILRSPNRSSVSGSTVGSPTASPTASSTASGHRDTLRSPRRSLSSASGSTAGSRTTSPTASGHRSGSGSSTTFGRLRISCPSHLDDSGYWTDHPTEAPEGKEVLDYWALKRRFSKVLSQKQDYDWGVYKAKTSVGIKRVT